MSFEQLKNIIDQNKEREENLSEDEDLSYNICPDCYWNLDINSEGKRSCPICGRIYK
jgi:rubrerythrin